MVQPARRLLSTLTLSLSLSALACASGTDDSNGSGLSVGPITQPGSNPSVAGETTAPATGSITDEGEPPTGDAEGEAEEEEGPVAVCGNGQIDPNEECDGAELDGQDCVGFGYSGGTLLCTASCSFDFAMCAAGPACGDGVVDMGESCDCGNMGGACSPAQLGNIDCTGLPSPKGTAFGGGTLACNAPSCTHNTVGCTYCGDGKRNGAEACDAADLGGATCATQGFTSGALSCSETCSFNTAGCMTIVCGDGMCQQGEDSCTCPSDCVENPNACDPCECGTMNGGNCACDPFCLAFGDCCPNAPC